MQKKQITVKFSNSLIPHCLDYYQ